MKAILLVVLVLLVACGDNAPSAVDAAPAVDGPIYPVCIGATVPAQMCGRDDPVCRCGDALCCPARPDAGVCKTDAGKGC